METFSASLAFCAGNSPVTGEFPPQRPVTRSFDFFFGLRLNKCLSTQSWDWWFETPSRSLWRHCNETTTIFSIHTFYVIEQIPSVFSSNDAVLRKHVFRNTAQMSWYWSKMQQIYCKNYPMPWKSIIYTKTLLKNLRTTWGLFRYHI